jgi:tRNA(Leu) C34 or U34 (ribose-2'-O)-methylase TrmL
METRQHSSVHMEARHALQYVLRGTEDWRIRVRQAGKLVGSLRVDQEGPRPIARSQRTSQHQLSLGDEQAMGRLPSRPQLYVRQGSVVRDTRVIGVGNRRDGHALDSPRYSSHAGIGTALGFDAVLLSPSCTDPLYRRSVRVSMGEVFAVPYARLEPWPDALGAVRAAGFTLLALTPAAGAVPIQRLSAEQRRRPALLFGAEGPGRSAPVLRAADVRVAIPMRAGVDSLNVAAAAAVACWELVRSA